MHDHKYELYEDSNNFVDMNEYFVCIIIKAELTVHTCRLAGLKLVLQHLCLAQHNIVR